MLRIHEPAASSSLMDVDSARAYNEEEDSDYDDDDMSEGEEGGLGPLAAVGELRSLPLGELLARAAPLLGQEDSRLPAAFVLLERLKVNNESQWRDRWI